MSIKEKKRSISKLRVLVIGLDGVALTQIKQMVRKGKLPNFRRLIQEGAYGNLESTMPPVTPCAWTSFVTGKDPCKHGLYDFFLHYGDPNEKKLANRNFVKAKSLWRILSEAGKKSIVMDVPLTYPAEKINGVQISRIMAPVNKNSVHPQSLYYTLRNKGFIREKKQADCSKKKVRHIIKKGASIDKSRRKEEKKKQQFAILKKKIAESLKLAKWLLKQKSWDFFMVVFMAADIAGHYFWADKQKMEEIYEDLDRAVGDIFRETDNNTIKFVMSDHGFTSIRYIFHANRWLLKEGLLSKDLRISTKDEKIVKKIIYAAKNKGKKKAKSEKLLRFSYNIEPDYRRSEAYLQSITSYGLRINLKGRDKTGIVERKDYEKLRNYLIKKLKGISDSKTKKNIFSEVIKKESVYPQTSSSIDPLPDIILSNLDFTVWLSNALHQDGEVLQRVRGRGNHHPQGIFFCQGKDIRKLKLNSPKITDIMPTILHIFGIGLPNDLDGNVLKEIFTDNSDYVKRDIVYQESSLLNNPTESYSRSEEAEVIERLKELGYVD